MLALLVPLAIVTGGEDEAEPVRIPPVAPVATIAERVQEVRGVRFEQLPEPETVTPAQARAEGLAALDDEYPPREREADVAVMRLLGLIGDDVDLEQVYSSIYETQVAGYYDVVRKRLRIVAGAAQASRANAEIILAHELNHALEDQVFGYDVDDVAGLDDRALAYTAFVEGTASAVMFEYAARHFSSEEVLVGLLASGFTPPGNIPSFLQARLSWPYIGGQVFAERLFQAAGDWTLIDIGLRRRPPASTEQVMHPDAYLRFEDPVAVRVGDPDLGEGWRTVTSGTLGEWQTAEVLREAGGTGGPVAAQGWGGDRYVLFAGPAGHALVVRWRWDSPAEQREFVSKLREYAASEAPGGPVAVRVRGGSVTLAVADDPTVVRRLVRAP